VMASLNIKNIPTGPGDDIKVDASYAKGTTKNVIATSGTSPSFVQPDLRFENSRLHPLII
jgi:hypothetical protein